MTDEADMPSGQEARHLGGHLWLVRPKTNAGRRLTPIPNELAEELREYIDRHGLNQNGLVFHRDSGAPYGPLVEGRAWAEALKRSGLPHMRVHSARHTAAHVRAGSRG